MPRIGHYLWVHNHHVTGKQSIKSCKNYIFSTCTNPIIHLIYPQKMCIGIVLDYSWDMFMSQEKLQTMSMQNFWGVKEVHYGIVQVVNTI